MIGVPVWLVSYMVMQHGQVQYVSRELNAAQYRRFVRVWARGRNCPGVDCLQVTGVRVELKAASLGPMKK